MPDAPLMLGISGLRGITGESLTPGVARRYAWTLGRMLAQRAGPTPRVVIGADGRAGFEPLHAACIEGLVTAGCAVYDLGVAMTPTVGVEADRLDAAAGVIVTASHNPQEWNGIKVLVREATGGGIVSAAAPPPELAADLVERFAVSPEPPATALRADRVQRLDGASRAHVALVVGALSAAGFDAAAIRARRVRVVLDSVNGAGRFAGRTLLTHALGCDLVHLGAEETGLFPHPPEPTRKHLAGLGDSVRRFDADVGFAQDPDGDRLAIIDERGEYIGEEYTLALAARALLESGAAAPSPVLATNLSTSRMIDDVAGQHGGRVVRTPVGEAHVAGALRAARDAALLGGEGNGGVVWPRVTFVRDSLAAMALALALMVRTGKAVSELVAELPAYAIEKRSLPLADRAAASAGLDAIARTLATGARLDRQDGVRLDWESRRAWLHVRPSNTEPILRLIAEAPTADEAAALLDDAHRAVTRA